MFDCGIVPKFVEKLVCRAGIWVDSRLCKIDSNCCGPASVALEKCVLKVWFMALRKFEIEFTTNPRDWLIAASGHIVV